MAASSALTTPSLPGMTGREQMADALAAAVERLRTRAEQAMPPAPEPALAPPRGGAAAIVPGPDAQGTDTPAPSPPVTRAAPAQRPKPHRHSMSLIGRLRAARKQRREAR